MSLANAQQLEFAVSPFGEVYLPVVNRRQFESKDSTRIFNEQYSGLLDDGFLNIVVGTDSGLLANYVLENANFDNSRFIFVELNLVTQSLSVEIPPEHQSALRVVPIEALAELLETDNNDIFILKNKMRLFESQGAKKAYLDTYQSLKTEANAIADKAAFNVSVNLTQKNFVHKQLINICDNLHPISHLKDRFKGEDCIVIGGGPSLDEHLGWLNQNQSSLCVIAVSRAAHQLQQAGIMVDIVVSVDPQDVSFTVSKGMLELPKRTLFVNADHAAPALVGQWHGVQFYTGSRLPWQPEENVETAGPTVSNAAISIANSLGFQRILLLGVDLCWSPQGVSHASGSVEGQLGPDISKIGVWVDTYSGQKAETTLQLAEAIRSLAEQVARFNSCQVINLSVSAAHIVGIDYQSPETLTLNTTSLTQQILDNILLQYSAMPPKQALIKLKSLIQSNKKKYRQIAAIANKALAQLPRWPECAGQLDSLETELNSEFSLQVRFMKFYGYTEFSRFLSTQSAQYWDHSKMKAMHQDYYGAMKHVAESLCSCLETAIHHIEARVEENKHSPKLAILIDDWIRYKQPQRLLQMITNRPHWVDSLTSAEHLQLAQVKDLARQQMQESLRQKFTNPKAKVWGLKMVPQKIHSLVESHNIHGLNQLIYALDTYQTSDESKTLSARAKSYLYEIQGDYQQAFQVLADLPEDWRGEVENKQMVLMALKTTRLDAAVEGLHKLTPLSDEYMPQLAQVLKIKKDYAGALETWLEYLNKHPADSGNWCRLGEMLMQLEQYQDALTVYQQALQADPDNKLAEQYVTELSRALAQ